MANIINLSDLTGQRALNKFYTNLKKIYTKEKKHSQSTT